MANDILFANNASALLAASIGTGDTSIQVASGFGANFPSPSGGSYFYATLEDNAGNLEIVKCTARSADVLTVVRAQDGTTAKAFTLTVTRVELRLTKLTMEEVLQKNGGTMTGALDMNGNNITDAVLNGTSTQILAGEIVNVPLRGLTGISTNEIAVPINGTSRATAGGAAILCTGDDIVAELDTAGVITLNSATVGVNMDQSGAYLRMRGALRVANGAGTDYGEQSHDDTDYNWAFTNTNWLKLTGLTNGVDVTDLELKGQVIRDFSLTNQTVAAAATTNVNYIQGSYAIITMGTNISTLNITNPPASGVGSMRLKFVQDATGGRTCNFTGIYFPNGVAPTLSTAANAVDFVDLWYDPVAAVWYGAFDANWQAA